MKKIFTWMLWAMILRFGMNAFAQGTVYISSLGSSSGSGSTINDTIWIGQEFETGNNVGGYMFDSVQVQMAAASGNPSGFTLSLFSSASGLPSESLGILTGSASPASVGVYSYDASALNLVLAPSTDYYVVESATSPSSQGSYEWGVTGFANQVDLDGWGYPTALIAFSQDQGNDWALTGSRTDYQMAITATAVPEPSAWVLCLLGGGLVFAVRSRKRTSA